jgi:hypothetical protein
MSGQKTISPKELKERPVGSKGKDSVMSTFSIMNGNCDDLLSLSAQPESERHRHAYKRKRRAVAIGTDSPVHQDYQLFKYLSTVQYTHI